MGPFDIPLLECAARIIACIFIADFLSGFFHWLEDAYGHPNWPVTGRWITQPNILHHHNPRYFTRHSWFKSADVLMVLVGATLVLAWTLGCLNWMVILVAIIGVNANEIHKWSHRSRAENGRLIVLLQRVGILQSAAHHANHHRNPKNSHYCVVTNYLNPVLDGIRLWDALEVIGFRLFGVKRRVDQSIAQAKHDLLAQP